MGTRSITRVQEDGQTLVTVYQQYDGYPSGVGNALRDLLKDKILVNGFNSSMEIPTHFNGAGCLAAWLIGTLKGNKIGNVYIYPSDCERELVSQLNQFSMI